MNALAWVTGFRWRDGNLARFRWGEVSTGWGLALAVCKFEEHWALHLHLIYLNVFINLWHPRVEPKEMMETWGFSIPWEPGYGKLAAWHFNWGDKCKIVTMPWAWEWYRTSILAEDGKNWIHELTTHGGRVPVCGPVSEKWFFFSRDLPRWKEAHPYRYVLRSGEVQERTATIAVSEMEWRWRGLMWLAWPRKVTRTIDVEFSDEVGERSGSWKGGCIGCSYELRPTETPEECLRRMEAERKFA